MACMLKKTAYVGDIDLTNHDTNTLSDTTTLENLSVIETKQNHANRLEAYRQDKFLEAIVII